MSGRDVRVEFPDSQEPVTWLRFMSRDIDKIGVFFGDNPPIGKEPSYLAVRMST